MGAGALPTVAASVAVFSALAANGVSKLIIPTNAVAASNCRRPGFVNPELICSLLF
jgi:hypothetical protein